MIQGSTYNSLWGFFRLWKCYQNAFIFHWNEINETQKITNKVLLPIQEAWNVKEQTKQIKDPAEYWVIYISHS